MKNTIILLLTFIIFEGFAQDTADIAFGNDNIVLAYAKNTLPDANGLCHQAASYLLLNVQNNGKPQISYKNTQATIVDEYGNVLTASKAVSARLNPNGADKLFLLDGKAAWLTGKNNQWVLNVLDKNLNLEVFKLGF